MPTSMAYSTKCQEAMEQLYGIFHIAYALEFLYIAGECINGTTSFESFLAVSTKVKYYTYLWPKSNPLWLYSGSEK